MIRNELDEFEKLLEDKLAGESSCALLKTPSYFVYYLQKVLDLFKTSSNEKLEQSFISEPERKSIYSLKKKLDEKNKDQEKMINEYLQQRKSIE